MTSVINYYLPLLKFCENNNVDNNVCRYIFSYLKKDIQEIINLNFINSIILKHITYLDNNKYSSQFTLHLVDLPYKIKIEDLKTIVSTIFNNHNNIKYFSHYCCNNKGVVYISENEKYKNWHRII